MFVRSYTPDSSSIVQYHCMLPTACHLYCSATILWFPADWILPDLHCSFIVMTDDPMLPPEKACTIFCYSCCMKNTTINIFEVLFSNTQVIRHCVWFPSPLTKRPQSSLQVYGEGLFVPC
uniref:Uncharacterized protein n=1 Tax=Guillardia theta TaxID=55529 RepID=A0A7S4PN03_GUITH